MTEDAGHGLIRRLVFGDPWRLQVLRAVRDLGLPQGAVGAGFLRAAVWDHLHDLSTPTALDDIDVLFFDPDDLSKDREASLETSLAKHLPGPKWSVKNQARMHLKNGDAPYRDLAEAIAHWLETATCLAARLDRAERLTIIAPWGLEDLIALRLRPTPSGLRRPDAYQARLKQKNWQARWPLLSLAPGP
jgi:hypothetical protein